MSTTDSESKRLLKELQAAVAKLKPSTPPIERITVNKRTHRVRFENETESEVTIVIEERGQ